MLSAVWWLLLSGAGAVAADAFDVKRANDTLHYAWSSYCNETALRTWSCEWCVGSNAPPRVQIQAYLADKLAGTQGFVGLDEAGGRIIVAFRGSSDLANDIEDAEFWMTGTPFGPDDVKVEHGFLQAYHSLRNTTLGTIAVASAACPACSLLFTGHSLGAAMATIAAVEVASDTTPRAIDLYTFGSPRVGNAAFVEYAQKIFNAHPGSTSTRMRRQLDIVPAIPPRSIGYRHLSTEVWDRHTDDGQADTFVVCDGSGEDPACGDSEEKPPFPLDLIHLKPSEHTRYLSYGGGGCTGG